MCGIVGYIGNRDSVPVLVEGLRRLEYRGYDSAGVAVVASGSISVRRRVGRLAELEAALGEEPLSGAPGIGHTRWATHGVPSDVNSHPHTNADATVAVVHNGIIENYLGLRSALQAEGHCFSSDTDTEVLPHLIEAERSRGAPTWIEAIRRALSKTEGAYALGIVCADDPDTLYAARHGSPLIIGCSEGEQFIASDLLAVVSHTRRVMYLEDGQIAALRRDRIDIVGADGATAALTPVDVTVTDQSTDCSGFDTYMLKEIHEQPRVLRSLLRKHVTPDNAVRLDGWTVTGEELRSVRRIMSISCGTAYHAAMYGKLLLESLSDIAVEADFGSEFRYRHAKISSDTLILAISQSGETTDTLASVRMAKERGCRLLSICNVPASTLTRESDAVLYTEAGPEIGVASTKAYTTQLMMLALFSIYVARTRGELSREQELDLLEELRKVPDAIHYVIERKDEIKAVADKHYEGPSSLYLGRRFNYPTALEGALKNKEISYQHAEAYAAGEMKHGPIALISEYLPVVCICTRTQDIVYEKTLSNMQEVRARNGRIVAVATDGDTRVADLAEDVLFVPEVADPFSPMVNVVALQLLAYFSAQARGTDIDKPRNLAKSVTVE